MSIFSSFPFIRILIAFIPGILFAKTITLPLELLFFSGAILLLFILILRSKKKTIKNLIDYKSGFFQLFFFILLGIIVAKINYKENNENHFIHSVQFEENYNCVLQLTSVVEEKEKTKKLSVEIIAIQNAKQWKSTFGKSIIYHLKDSITNAELEYGDVFLARIKFNKLPIIKNPGDFDYGNYLKLNGIYATGFSSTPIKKLDHRKSLFSIANKISSGITGLISSATENKNCSAFLTALLIGIKSDVDEEIINGFSVTGTLHVLSVSGLHTGLLFFAFQTILQFVLGKEKNKAVFTFLILLLLWFYAFITGLSPSVTRAVLMISVVIIGKYFNYKTNIYNSLAAAAFILLCYNPNYLYQLSFLLSFVAVLGIIYLQEKIYSLVYIKNKWLDKIWILCSVSIAAQLATLPICLYNFGTFPVYFLISNLLVIPITTFILYLTLFYLCISFIPILSIWIFQLIEWSVDFLFLLIKLLSNLPISSYQISIGFYECILYYICFFLIAIFHQTQKYKWINSAMIVLIIALSIRLTNTIEFGKKTTLHLLSGKDEISFYWRNNTGNYFISNFDNKRVLQSLSSFAIQSKEELPIQIALDTNKYTNKNLGFCAYRNFYSFADKIFFIPPKKYKISNSASALKINYLVLNYHPYQQLEKMIYVFKPELIILSESLSDYYKMEIIKILKKLNVNYYDQKEKGAFYLEF